MADSNELNTFDNKAYVKGDEAADGNGNQVKEKNSSNYGGDKESLKENRFANLNPEEIRIVKKGIYKNVIIIAIAFMLLFTAFQSMANLQSSINKVCNDSSICLLSFVFYWISKILNIFCKPYKQFIND